MALSLLTRFAVACALVALPAVALAEVPPYGNGNYGNYGYNNGQMSAQQRDFFRAVRSLDLSPAQRSQIRAIEQNSNNQNEAQVRAQVYNVLTPDQQNRLRAELRNGSYNGGYGNGGYNNGGYNNGRRNCDPDNDGDRDNCRHRRHGRDNGYGRNGGYNNGGYNNGGYNYGNTLNVTISSFNRFDLYASNGTHVILHQGTIINPTGTTLRAGQRVTIYGHPNGDGTFAADRIDVNGYY